MADTATTPTTADKPKPPKPDQDKFNEEVQKLEKEHNENMTKYNAIRAQIDAAQGKNKDTPQQKRRAELIAEAAEIRQKQGGAKSARGAKLEQVKRLDEQLRSRIAEQKTARGRVSFKSVEDVDREIKRLDDQVNGGMMKLVDEKKALAEISGLRKTRKTFGQFDDAQKGIDDLRAKIKEIKDSMADPEGKALSDRYDVVQAEIDAIKAEQDVAFKSLSALRDERTRLNKLQQESFGAVRMARDDFYAAKKAFGEWEREQRQKTRDRQRAEREKYEMEKRKERANKMLQEASDPAFLEEIRRANSLLHFFDPASAAAGAKSPLLADQGLGATAQRKVDDAGMKGVKLLRKEDREEEFMPAVKKGKKGKKGGAASAATDAPSPSSSAKFSLPPSVMEDCAFMGIDPPMSQADVPAAVEKVKKKLDSWKADQASQTQKNVDKAKKEIEKLEAEEAAAGSGSGPATPNGVNVDSKRSVDTDKAVAEVTKDLKDTSLEEKKTEETTA